MANTIRIKRRASTGASGAPTSLANAELAYNEADDTLYYGFGSGGAGGTATQVIPIAGTGAFAALTGNQTIAGNKTFSSTVTASITGNAGTATALQTARNFSITGDVTAPVISFSGTGDVALASTLANSGVTAGTYTKVTVDAKGRTTVGATARLDELAAPTASVPFGMQKITNLATPTLASDAATKEYVDELAQGLKVKAAARVASTANITLMGLQTIDGVITNEGDRVLVKDQTIQANNGIYLASANAWTRTTDADTWTELVAASVFVTMGSLQANTTWVAQIPVNGTIGVDPIVFNQFSAASNYTAGDGLMLTGVQFAAKLDGTTLSVSSAGLRVANTYAGQATITTVGTLTAGALGAGFSTVGITQGGTGLSTIINGLVRGTTGQSAYAMAMPGVDYLNPDSTIDGGMF